MRGHVYPFLGVSCGIWFWVSKRERERSNRVEEGERAAQYGRERESTKRESVQCVSQSLQKGVFRGLTLILLSQYLTLLHSTFKSDS